MSRGELTRAELYGPRFRRLLPGVFGPADLVVDLAVRTEAAHLLFGDRGGARRLLGRAGAGRRPRSA